MGEDNIYTYSIGTSGTNNYYTISNSSGSCTAATIDGDWLKEQIDNLHKESLKDVELPEDKTSVDLAKLTSEVIIGFLRSPEGISLLANELDKYFKK
jgi:hypothetical protein